MRRGISPIIAAVLLVIIAVAAGVMIWTWISGYAQKSPTTQPSLNERIKIDSVYVDKDSGTVRVYVSNIGTVTVTISSAYILDAVTGNTLCYNTSAGVTIISGSVDSITISNCANKLQSGSPYIAKVITKYGTEAVYTFVAP